MFIYTNNNLKNNYINTNMKVTVLITLLFSVTLGALYPPEQIAFFTGLLKECQKETQPDLDLVNKFMDGHITDDAKLKDFVYCYLKKHNIFNENGSVNEQTLKRFADSLPPPANKVLHKCANERGSTGAKTAFLIAKCYIGGFPDNVKPGVNI